MTAPEMLPNFSDLSLCGGRGRGGACGGVATIMGYLGNAKWDTEVCEICQDPLSDDVNTDKWPFPGGSFITMACTNGHVFHKACLRKMLAADTNSNCPVCRNTILLEVKSDVTRPLPGDEAPAEEQSLRPPQRNVAPRHLPRLRPGEERLGPQRASDRLLQWHFWVKVTQSNAGLLHQERFKTIIRRTFVGYLFQNASLGGDIAPWSRRLVLSVRQHSAQITGEATPSSDARVACVTCKLYVDQNAAIVFPNWFNEQKRVHGISSLIRRMFGIIGGHSFGTNGMNVFDYGRHWFLQENPGSMPADPVPVPLTQSTYNKMLPYSMEGDAQPVVIGQRGPQSSTDRPIEWRFWVKGDVTDPTGFRIGVIQYLAQWFTDNLLFTQFVGRDQSVGTFALQERLVMEISLRFVVGLSPSGIYNYQAVRGSYDSPTTRCDFQLYMPTDELARQFIDVAQRVADVRSLQDVDGFSELMAKMVGVTGAIKTVPEDFPTIRSTEGISMRMGPYAYYPVSKPVMSLAEYNAW